MRQSELIPLIQLVFTQLKAKPEIHTSSSLQTLPGKCTEIKCNYSLTWSV